MKKVFFVFLKYYDLCLFHRRMFEEKVDLKHVINVESIKPHNVKRPSEHVPEQYEDTPEFRQSMNLKVFLINFLCQTLCENKIYIKSSQNIRTSIKLILGRRKRGSSQEVTSKARSKEDVPRACSWYKCKGIVARC